MFGEVVWSSNPGFFTELGQYFSSIIIGITDETAQEFVKKLMGLFSVTLVISIMIKGYQTLAGKSQEPIRELIWDLVIKSIIITFALNLNGYLKLVINAMNEMYVVVGGGEQFYSRLDSLYTQIKDLSDIINFRNEGLAGWKSSLAYCLIWASFALCVLPMLSLIAYSALSQTILMMLAPIVFFCTMYGFLKNMFQQWLGMVISNIFTILIVSLVFEEVQKAISALMFKLIHEIQIGAGSVFEPAIKMAFLGFILLIITKVSVLIAEKLSQVSIDSITQSGLINSIMPAGILASKASGFIAGKSSQLTNKGATAATNSVTNNVKEKMNLRKDLQKEARNAN